MSLGVHVSKASKVLDEDKLPDTMSEALKRDIDELKLDAAQIFTHGPMSSKENIIDYDKVKALVNRTELSLVCHANYLIVSMWDITKENAGSKARKLNELKKELEAAAKCGAWGLVCHIKKKTPQQIAETMEVIKPIVQATGVVLLIETAAFKSAGNLTYETAEKINTLTDLIGPANWWGWTVDTAHIWCAGFDDKTYSQMHNWLSTIKHPKSIKLFHLNGCMTALSSGKDKHAIPFSKEDLIWGEYRGKEHESGLRAVVEFAKHHKVAMILEINIGKEEDTRYALNCIKRMR